MLALATIAQIIGGTLFPRLAYWLRWPSRLSLRGSLVYVAWRVLVQVSYTRLRAGLIAQRETVKDHLRDQLGREPTEHEIRREFARRALRAEHGREPTDAELADLLNGR